MITLSRTGTYSRWCYANQGKRALDICIAVPALLVASPLLLVTGAIIWCTDRGPALFRQKRVGLNGEEFTIYKLRSMPVSTPNMGPVEAAKALKPTAIGNVIRRTSIDELPQLINVIKGDMSIVGFRPALRIEDDLYDCRENLSVHRRIKPGLTGLSQLKYYVGIPEQDKAQMDADYADEVTLTRDLAIIVQTFGYLARRVGRDTAT